MNDGRYDISDAAAAAADAGGRAVGERYLFGVGTVLFAMLLWSSSGILMRSIETASQWPVVFYRSATMAATVFAIIAVSHRGRVVRAFRAAGGLGVLGGLFFAASTICFIFSITSTTVANTAFLSATAPLFAAVLAWIALKERVRAATWIAMAAALLGVALMVVEGVAAGRLSGNLLAVGSALTFAALTVALRGGRRVDMLPSVCLGGAFAALVGLLFAADLAISVRDLALCVVMGTVQLSAPLVLFIVGSRHLSAVELSLLSLLDVVLSPLWVWLGIGETPSGLTLAGGAIVLTAIVGQALSGARRLRPPVGAV